MATNAQLNEFLKQDGNLLDLLDDTQVAKLAGYIENGVDIDERSREIWLKRNLEAMDLIKHIEDPELESSYSTDNIKSCKVIYPILASSAIHAASRLIPHFTRNNKTCEIAVHGSDPTGAKMQRAEDTAAYINYQLLYENDSWLKESHKLAHMIMTWGMGFRRVFYDNDEEALDFQLISPADIIINHNVSTLKKAPRITIRHFMSDIDLVEKMRNDEFEEIDLNILNGNSLEIEKNDPNEAPAIHEIYEQYCRFDLDDDGYAEPIKCFFHAGSSRLLAVQLAFVRGDIKFNKSGQVRKIAFKHNIVDYHCIDDPEGGYYSLGLNHLLLHPNKVINTLQRQIVDAGTAANQQGGFYTEAFKTNDKHLRFKKNQFQKVSISPGQRIQDQIMPLPFKEPSQVLYSFLGMMNENTKELGFITDALTGDASGQNVPATTMLAIIEQGTRAFKPVIQKLYISLKQEFKLIFELNYKYMSETKYMKFLDKEFYVSKEDFNITDYDICPVADPTMASEAHKFARSQGMFQLLQLQLPYVNGMQIVMDYMDTMGVDNVDKYIVQAPAAPATPDPKVMKVMSDAQNNAGKLQIAKQEQDRKDRQLEIDQEKLTLGKMTTFSKLDESGHKQDQAQFEAHRAGAEFSLQQRQTAVAEEKVVNEKRRLEILSKRGGSNLGSGDLGKGTKS